VPEHNAQSAFRERRRRAVAGELDGSEGVEQGGGPSGQPRGRALEYGSEGQLGIAVQLCALRWLGFVPEDL
jgi:hypothetical protein